MPGCLKRFARRSDLRLHESRHTTRSSYAHRPVCRSCGLSFSRQSDLEVCRGTYWSVICSNSVRGFSFHDNKCGNDFKSPRSPAVSAQPFYRLFTPYLSHFQSHEVCHDALSKRDRNAVQTASLSLHGFPSSSSTTSNPAAHQALTNFVDSAIPQGIPTSAMSSPFLFSSQLLNTTAPSLRGPDMMALPMGFPPFHAGISPHLPGMQVPFHVTPMLLPPFNLMPPWMLPMPAPSDQLIPASSSSQAVPSSAPSASTSQPAQDPAPAPARSSTTPPSQNLTPDDINCSNILTSLSRPVTSAKRYKSNDAHMISAAPISKSPKPASAAGELRIRALKNSIILRNIAQDSLAAIKNRPKSEAKKPVVVKDNGSIDPAEDAASHHHRTGCGHPMVWHNVCELHYDARIKEIYAHIYILIGSF